MSLAGLTNLPGHGVQRRMLVTAFFESFVTTLVERGIYFYTCHALGFGDRANLLLALAFGLVYAATAAVSHRLTARWGERAMLACALGGQFVVTLLMAAIPSAAVVVAGTVLLGGLYGLKWPVIESYMLAGDTPSQAVRSVGRFSIAWSIAVPLGLAVAGPLIDAGRAWLFVAALLGGIPAAVAAWGLPARPAHLPDDHPERVSPETAVRWQRLLVASRALMFASYAQLWVLAALLPGIYTRLGCAVALAAGLSGVLDLMRWQAFCIFGRWTTWHDRRWPIVAVAIGQPLGFALACFGGSLAWVLAGELVFGLSAGLAYYAALYYAMALERGAVKAGGGHEGLIGLGFAAGPGLAVLGSTLGRGTAGAIPALGILVLACITAALVTTRRLPR
jgi:MFS family permease